MCDVGACLGVLRPPSPPILELSFEVVVLAFFGVHFWEPRFAYYMQKTIRFCSPRRVVRTEKDGFQMGRLGGLSTPRQAPTSHTYAKKLPTQTSKKT